MSSPTPTRPSRLRWLLPITLVMVLGIPLSVIAAHAFDDVPDSNTFHDAIGWLAENDITTERIAQSRIEIDQARLLVLHAAYMMDTVGNKAARQAIAEIKVAVPNITGRVVERAMQLHGGGGVSQEFPLASMWAHSRTLRFADGPDEVHRRQIGRLELRKHS